MYIYVYIKCPKRQVGKAIWKKKSKGSTGWKQGTLKCNARVYTNEAENIAHLTIHLKNSSKSIVLWLWYDENDDADFLAYLLL